MIFRQFNFDGCLGYVMACEKEKTGIIIDPSHETGPFLDFVESEGITITHIIDTHTHVDHVSLAPELADVLGAKTVMNVNTPSQRAIGATVTDLFGIEKILAENARKRIDIYLDNGDKIEIGKITLTVIHTKGHTQDHICLLVQDRIFTGDTLIIGQCGRTDLPGGSSEDMFESLFGKIMPLSDDLIVYPAHDYKGNINSSLGYEKINNVCLGTKRTVEEFGRFLKGLFPPLNAQTGKLQCGLSMEPSADTGELGPLMKSMCISMESYLTSPHGETLIQPEEVLQKIKARESVFIVDVREPKELKETGFIEGAMNIPVREVAKRVSEFPGNLDTPIVVYCASGARSSHAAIYLRAYGYRNVKNLEYGIHGWTDRNYPLVKTV
ncbi:MAG TPA: rhodanese-like domain-containing protein [Syntrophorhabdaceae bacterium]|nr:rhodanese-like domain-containing protein [Syntrophorhabdaceae bacterium]